MTKALLVIDVQNDYFPGGLFPLWSADETLGRIERVVATCRARGVPVIVIQHLADPAAGPSPFFNRGTLGAEIHPRLRAAAPEAIVIEKTFADSFVGTTLEATLTKLGVTELLLCGMMTQNCVTHTAISRSAEKYDTKILVDCCTTVTELLHLIALHAVSTRQKLVPSTEALGG
jgi:nicotinamidase-related amidase